MAGLQRLVLVLALLGVGVLAPTVLGGIVRDDVAASTCKTACCGKAVCMCCDGDSRSSGHCDNAQCVGRRGGELPVQLTVEHPSVPCLMRASGLGAADPGEPLLFADVDDPWSSRRPSPERTPPRA